MAHTLQTQRFQVSGLRQNLAGALLAPAMAVGCLISPLIAADADAPIAKKHEVQAAFAYNFLKFVEWPAGRLQETNAPLVIGVVGKGSIRAALEDAVRDRQIHGRPLLVKAVETPDEARTAHLLFVTATEDKRLDDWLPAFAGSGVLTVGESAAFAQQGGIITFVPEGDKLRFEINMDSAKRAGLKVSAQLQKLARAIRKE